MAIFPNIAPDHPVPKRTSPLNSKLMLGDGYESSLRFGLNNVRSEWQLTWQTFSANATIIENFLQACANSGDPFEWQPPDYGYLLRWKCDEWNVEDIAYNWCKVTATFRQVYERRDGEAEADGATLGFVIYFVPGIGNSADVTIDGASLTIGTSFTGGAPQVITSDIYFNRTVLLLHMDGANNSATFTDSSPYFQSMLPIGAQISTAQYKYGGSSGYFSGSAAYARVNSTSQFAMGTGDFTMEAWTYLTGGGALAGGASIMNIHYSGGSAYIRYGATAEGYKLMATVQGGASVIYSCAITQSTYQNQWIHVALTRQSGVCRLFVNGVAQALGSGTNPSTYPLSSFTDTTNITSVSAVNVGYVQGVSYWTGYIDDLRITKGVARYTNTFTAPVAAFPDSGPATADTYYGSVLLLLHANGTNGSTTFTDSGPSPVSVTTRGGNTQITTAQSKFGGSSIAFDGDGDYLQYNLLFDTVGTQFTVETWLYPTAYKSNGLRIWSAGGAGGVVWNGTTGIHFLAQLNGTGLPSLQFWNGSAAAGVQGTNAVPLNAWSHLAISVTGGNVYIAVNGVMDTFTGQTIVRPSGFTIFDLGTINGENGNTTYAFAGYMDEFRVTKNVARYTSSFTPPTTPFLDTFDF